MGAFLSCSFCSAHETRMPKKRPSTSKTGSKKTSGAAASDDNQAKGGQPKSPALAGYRETVESFCVAIILAMLFRAFVAEAFVIPTGSMAPTLMGKHKDLFCDQCEYNFRVGASVEDRDPQTMGFRGERQTVVGGRCPNCRAVNVLSLRSKPNDQTFSGDRILVSKFSYALQEPQRWDVIVFKFPGNPKQAYIKRLVGLPNETLRIHHGDIFVKPTGEDNFDIARKPDNKVLPTSHLVYDSTHQAPALLKAKYPARLQPWRAGAATPPADSWQVERTPGALVATVEAADQPQWLRYYHNYPSDREWVRVLNDQPLVDVDPYRGKAITDFYAYDSYLTVGHSAVYGAEGIRSQYVDGLFPYPPTDNVAFGGALHWVGDLTFEADLQTDDDAESVTLEIVEAGVRYQCQIDLNDGTATLGILGDAALPFADGSIRRTAETSVRAGESQQLRFSNVDQELRLWVDGDRVAFDAPAVFDPETFAPDRSYRPYTNAEHPLDAAPAGIAVEGGARLTRFRLLRDQYYIASDGSQPMADYANKFSVARIHTILRTPDQWAATDLWDQLDPLDFTLEANQYFPMGDNSPESKDARSWAEEPPPWNRAPDLDAYKYANKSFVPRELLVGKALAVFWPHPWNSPIPYTPNFRRMKLIR